MALSWKKIAELALDSLSTEERESSIVYLDEQVLTEGSTVQIGEKEVTVPWPAVVVFVDLQPGLNWGHACRYLLVNASTGELRSFSSELPPFLRRPSETLRVIWKADSVPQWAVVQS